MTKRNLAGRLIGYEIAGFAGIILLLWLDEALDIPHRLLGAAPTAVNIREGILESALVLLFGLAVIAVTRRLLQRISYLEGILSICSYCKRIRSGDDWVQLEQYIDAHSEAMFSHGICPDCLQELEK